MCENGPTSDGNEYEYFSIKFSLFSSHLWRPTGHPGLRVVKMRTADTKASADCLKMKYYVQNKNSNLFPLSLHRCHFCFCHSLCLGCAPLITIWKYIPKCNTTGKFGIVAIKSRRLVNILWYRPAAPLYN